MHPKFRGLGLPNNGPFWADHVRNIFVAYLRVLRAVYLNRLSPAFSTASEEADTVSDEAWQRLGKHAAVVADPGDLAEAAIEAGIDRYVMLMDAKQMVANVFAVTLHHLLDQQQIFLLRRKLLHLGDEHNTKLHTRDRFIAELQAQGIDPTKYASWETLNDLRLVANAVKHGDGSAVESLKRRRPALFTHPANRQWYTEAGMDAMEMVQYHKVYQPLAGDDLYVTDEEIVEFFDAAEAFWEQIARDFYEAAGFEG